MRINSRCRRSLLAAAGTLLAACHGDRPTVLPGSATHLVFLDDVPASTVSLEPLSPIRVAFMTADNQVAASHSGTISIALISADTTAHVMGTADAVAHGGIATFADLTIDRAGSGYTFLAHAGALAQATSTPFGITAGKPSKLRFVIRPNSAVAGDTMTVSVGFADAGGNAVADTNALITLASVTLSSDPVFGAASEASANGVAVFRGVSLRKAGDQSISATAPGFGSVNSAPILVVSGPLMQWRFETQPTTGIAGVTLPSTVDRCTDQYGNPPTFPASSLSSQVTLTFGENPSGAILTGTVTQFGPGVIAFNDLKVDRPGVGY
jgi:hypothetical protein